MAREVSTFVISLTPFAEDGALDEAGLRAHLRRLAASGIGIYVGGSGSGEAYTLSPQERARVLEIAREEVGKDTPLRAMGVEPRSAAEMIAYAEQVKAADIDAMQIYSLDEGHGNRPKDRELETFLRDVLDAVTCPVVLSSHQSVGYALPRELVVELIESYDQIIGINFTHQDIGALVRMIEAVAGRIDIHVGGPMQAITALALGAQGFLSSEGNLAPKLCVRVIEHHRRGELMERDAAFKKLLKLFSETRELGGIAATKGGLRALGLAGGWPRRPRLPVDSAAGRRLAKCFEELSLREIEGLGA